MVVGFNNYNDCNYYVRILEDNNDIKSQGFEYNIFSVVPIQPIHLKALIYNSHHRCSNCTTR